jgi:hypothetical protein
LNQTSVADRFTATNYPVATSDIVALLTLEHQVHATNLLTRISQASRTGGEARDEATTDGLVEELVAYLTFAEEAPLRARVAGVSGFANAFSRAGPRDRQGRSLRDFNLEVRLFTYPLSYMIYSAAFDAIPASLRTRIYRRLYDELRRGQSLAGRYTDIERDAAIRIVKATKRDVPAFWGGGP